MGVRRTSAVRRRSYLLRVSGGIGVDEAVLRHQLQILRPRDETVEATIDEPLRHLPPRIPKTPPPRRFGDDPDLRPVVLGSDTPGAVVTGADAGFAEEGGLGLLACVQHERREGA